MKSYGKLYSVTVDFKKYSKEYENVEEFTLLSSPDKPIQRLFIQESSGKTHIFNWSHILGYHYVLMNEHNAH